MLLVFALLILTADVCYGGIIPITDCGDDSSSVKMTELEMPSYPPFVPEEEKYITYKFTVLKPTSADLTLNSTSTWKFRCEGEKEVTITANCSRKHPHDCLHFKDGLCKRIASVGAKNVKKYTLCEQILTPGDYEWTILIGRINMMCKITYVQFAINLMDGSEKVGCFIINPEFS